MPPLNTVQKEKADAYLAAHFHTTGTAFQRSESKYLIEFARILRPDYKMPNRKRVGGELLSRSVYDHINKKIAKIFEDISNI